MARLDQEQRWIAQTLARVPQLGEPVSQPGTIMFFPWLTADFPGVMGHP